MRYAEGDLMSHTPGPWTLHDADQEWEGDEPPEREFRWWVGQDIEPAFVADVLSREDGVLIASAPDLLAALKHVQRLNRQRPMFGGDFSAEIDAVIAEVEGEA